jgi:hypothetical protein
MEKIEKTILKFWLKFEKIEICHENLKWKIEFFIFFKFEFFYFFFKFEMKNFV